MCIFIIDQELLAHELMGRIIDCDHSLSFKQFLNQLDLLYIYIFLYLQQI
jgi:hypothetical protein